MVMLHVIFHVQVSQDNEIKGVHKGCGILRCGFNNMTCGSKGRARQARQEGVRLHEEQEEEQQRRGSPMIQSLHHGEMMAVLVEQEQEEASAGGWRNSRNDQQKHDNDTFALKLQCSVTVSFMRESLARAITSFFRDDVIHAKMMISSLHNHSC
jgi:hypothetical protein